MPEMRTIHSQNERMVMRDRRLLTLDEAAIKRRAVAYSESIQRSLSR